MSKKKRKIKVRRKWTINPVTRIKGDEREKYEREAKRIRKEISEGIREHGLSLGEK